MWADNIAHLDISSWVGISIGADHVYGKICYQGDEISVMRILTKEDAHRLNIKDKTEIGFAMYSEGEECKRFDTRSELIKKAIEIVKEKYPQVDLLLRGSGASVSCNEALWGKDQQKVDRINKLYREADKLDFYSGKDDDRMEELDDEFEKIVGLQILK